MDGPRRGRRGVFTSDLIPLLLHLPRGLRAGQGRSPGVPIMFKVNLHSGPAVAPPLSQDDDVLSLSQFLEASGVR